jgi:hypothetical protein
MRVRTAFAVGLVLGSIALLARLAAQPTATTDNKDNSGGNDIGGVVTSRFGPEAGVWVIAETRDRYALCQDRRDRRFRPLRAA